MNLAELGIPVRDSDLIDIDTYFEIVDLHIKSLDGETGSRRATQSDINKFLL